MYYKQVKYKSVYYKQAPLSSQMKYGFMFKHLLQELLLKADSPSNIPAYITFCNFQTCPQLSTSMWQETALGFPIGRTVQNTFESTSMQILLNSAIKFNV